MPLLNDFKVQRRTIWSAIAVLVAVGSLTVSLATRYYSPWDASSATVKTIQTHASPDARQRLTKNAATWVPPVFSFTVFQIPSFYPKIAPAGPPVRSLVCEETIYNRPPPGRLALS